MTGRFTHKVRNLLATLGLVGSSVLAAVPVNGCDGLTESLMAEIEWSSGDSWWGDSYGDDGAAWSSGYSPWTDYYTDDSYWAGSAYDYNYYD